MLQARAQAGWPVIGSVDPVSGDPVLHPFWKRCCSDPLGEGLGTMKLEYAAAARLWVEVVPEDGFGSCAYIAERKRRYKRVEVVGEVRCVVVSLNLDAAGWITFRLCFEDTDRLSIDEDHVVGVACAVQQREFSDDDTRIGR